MTEPTAVRRLSLHDAQAAVGADAHLRDTMQLNDAILAAVQRWLGTRPGAEVSMRYVNGHWRAEFEYLGEKVHYRAYSLHAALAGATLTAMDYPTWQ